MLTREVALTFDAEPGDEFPEHTLGRVGWELVLAGLRTDDLPATFFLQADWAARHPDLTRQTASDGHLIGCHTLNHLALGFHPSQTTDQVETGAAVIQAIVPAVPVRPWFRFPYFSGESSSTIRDTIRSLGWEAIGANCDSEDWNPHVGSPQDVADNVLKDFDRLLPDSSLPAIVLFHTWPRHTSAALPLLVKALRRRDVKFVRIDELAREQRALVPYGDPASLKAD